MIKIGLTGGIGSGKTYVSEIFHMLGIPVYNADERSKFLLNNKLDLVESIKEIFGKEAYKDNEMDRKYIASIVFSNKLKLEQLNQLSHPAVESDFEEWCQKYSNNAYVIKEAAILFESNAYRIMDKNILVVAPIELRIKRVIQRDDSTYDQIWQRINNQWPTDKLESLADFIIENDDKTLILPQILEIDKIIHAEWQNLGNG
jgi:dephospho-CoA kinase